MDMFSFLLGRNSGGGGKGGLKIQVVQELPETGEENILYLVPRQVTKNRNVFDEYIWVNSAWELIGTTDIDISGKQDVFQYSTMPAASASNSGKIYQYTGTTNVNYTNGYFYVCVSDGGNPATYSWANISVQDGGTSVLDENVMFLKTNDTSASTLEYVSNFLNNAIAAGKKRIGCIVMGERYSPDSYDRGLLLRNTLGLDAFKTGHNSQLSFRYFGILNYNRDPAYSHYIYPYISVTWNGDVLTATSITYSNSQDNDIAYALPTNSSSEYYPTYGFHPATKSYVDLLKFEYLGVTKWVKRTAYALDDVVYAVTGSNYGIVGEQETVKVYKCTTAHTSGDYFNSTEQANWTEITLTGDANILINKKYVDDAIASAGGGGTITRIKLNSGWSLPTNTDNTAALEAIGEKVMQGSAFDFEMLSYDETQNMKLIKYVKDQFTISYYFINPTLDAAGTYNELAFNRVYKVTALYAEATNETLSSYYMTTYDASFVGKEYLPLGEGSGYDATKTQTLKNVSGTLTWVDD